MGNTNFDRISTSRIDYLGIPQTGLETSRQFPCLALQTIKLSAVAGLTLAAIGPAAMAAEINKFFAPLSIDPGDVSTLTVTLFNNQSNTLTNAAVTDNLPVGMTIASPPNASTTCAGGTVTANAGETLFSLAGATVPAKTGSIDGSCSFSVNVTTTTQGNSVNTIPAGALTTDQNASNTTPASATLQVRTVNDPGMSKNFAPNTIFAGQPTALTLQITNNDPNVTLTNVGVTDTLPTNVTVAGPASTTCTNGTVSTTATSVTLSRASIPTGGANCTVTVPVTSTITGTYTNTVPAGSLTTHQGVTNSRRARATLAVQNLAVEKAFSPIVVPPNTPSTLTITLFNGSNNLYSGVGVIDTLPTGLTVAPVPNATTTCGSGAVTASSGAGSVSLSGGVLPGSSGLTIGSCTVSVDVIATADGTFDNTIPAQQVITDQGATNFAAATATLQTSSGAGGTLTLSKRFSPDLVAVNSPSRLRIRITNPDGGSQITGLALTDTMPANLVIATPANTRTNCTNGTVSATPGGNTVTVTGATLNAGRGCNVFVDVTSTTAALYTNIIPAGSITTNQGNTNSAAASDTLAVTPGIELSKAFFPDRIAPGGRSTLTLTVTNYLSVPLTGVGVVDNLPQTPTNNAIKIADPAQVSTTCANGDVSATVPGGSSLTLSGATVPAAQGGVPGVCTVQVEVTSDATSGRNDNVIAAGAIVNDQGVTNLQEATARLRFSPLELTATKAFNPLTVSGGSTSTLTVTLTNPSSQNYIGAAFTDMMPTGMQVASVPEATTTCTGGVITAPPVQTPLRLVVARFLPTAVVLYPSR